MEERREGRREGERERGREKEEAGGRGGERSGITVSLRLYVCGRPTMHLYIMHALYFEIYTKPLEGIPPCISVKFSYPHSTPVMYWDTLWTANTLLCLITLSQYNTNLLTSKQYCAISRKRLPSFIHHITVEFSTITRYG